MSFIVATLVRPEIQTMAQEELDAVTGRERLPTFEDRPRLPFVDAISKEVLRWRPVTPLGEFPTKHSSQEATRGYDDDPQVFRTRRQKTTSIRDFLSPRVGIFIVQICFAVG
jgi:Cytochrome P450